MMGRELPRRTVLVAGLSVASTAGAAWRAPGDERTRVVLVLRGGADGLSLVVPYQDSSYYGARPRTAVAAPTRSRMADLALDDRFALHPGLAPLKAMFAEGELSIGVAVGSPALDGSHANASAALHRYLEARFGGFAEGGAPAGEAIREGDPKTLVDRMRHLAAALRSKGQPGVHVVHCDGWDTHVAQGNGASGRLATLVDHLGHAVGTFRRELGREQNRVTLVVTSEFGRSLRETPMGGTDDGHAGVCFLLGGGIRGGRVFGRWPGLEGSALSGGRHVAATMSLASLLDQATVASR
jgi:uncharacterized protein (DUF1501 family)